MTPELAAELNELAERWRERARKFMAEAERVRTNADIVRLTAMASTLEWSARDLMTFVETEQQEKQP